MSRSTVPIFTPDKLRLRAPVPADRVAYQRLGRNPEIVNAFGGDTPTSLTISDKDAADWFTGITATPDLWVIEVADRFAGTARLHSFDMHDLRAAYAVGILDPKLLGHGIGTEVTRRVLAYAFGDRGLHRVRLRVLATNVRAIRCYQKCGFVVEGKERESGRVKGAWVDEIIMGITRFDWERLAHE